MLSKSLLSDDPSELLGMLSVHGRSLHPSCLLLASCLGAAGTDACSLPAAEFGILLTLLRSEDEVVVGNAALCLGNCMEAPGAATSLWKTDVVQLLLRHAGGDAQKTAVQLNAGIALGKLCTAEPRYAVAPGQVAPVGHVAEGAGPTKTLNGGWASVPPRTPEGVVGALVLPEHAGVGPVAASLRGRGGGGLPAPAGAGKCFSDGALFHARMATVFPPAHSLLLRQLLTPLPTHPPASHFCLGPEHMGECPGRVMFSCWRKQKREGEWHVADHLASRGKGSGL